MKKPLRARLGTAAAAGLLLAAVCAAFGGCNAAERRRDCTSAIWIPTTIRSPRVIGSFDGWQTPGTEPERYDDQHWLLRLELPPGEHQYMIVGDDGEPFTDPYNPLTAFRASDEEEVSLLVVGDCNAPLVTADEVSIDGANVSLHGRFLAGAENAKLDPGTLRVTAADGTSLTVDSADPDAGTWSAHGKGFAPGKHTFSVDAADLDGTAADAARAQAWIEPAAVERADTVIYQIMIDRYRGDSGAALDKPATLGSRAGGTLDGVRASIEDGTFDKLGVTTLWLSPVYENPTEARPGNDGHSYEAYHGYWPRDGRKVDDRLGGEEALRAVVDAAHARGLAVILDLVPNHVYEDSALYEEHRHDGWFNPAGCVCGTADCPWGEHIQECWFTPYLPDVHWQHPKAMTYAASEARYWLDEFDVDGFRIDAVPMMPRATTRRIAYELRDKTEKSSQPFLVGEVFTGPGQGGLQEIRAYLGPATLDSAFDFPLMWSLRDAIAGGHGGFEDVDATLDAGDEAFAGSGAHIAHMIDNHDVSRFVSVANGDDQQDPWSSPPIQPTSADVYARQKLGLVALYTLPGIPTLYYGDEVGLAGAGDPDSRRPMPAEEDLSDDQRDVRSVAESLGQLRRCSASLRGDVRKTVVADGHLYAFMRGDPAESPVLVLINAGAQAAPIALPDGDVASSGWVDALTGQPTDTKTLQLQPFAFEILVRAGDTCASK